MTCPKCGAHNLDEARFCESCGKKLYYNSDSQISKNKKPFSKLRENIRRNKVLCTIFAVAVIVFAFVVVLFC